MSRDTLSILKRHLQEKKHSVVLNIIQEHLYFDMYEGVARNKQQIEATSGAVVGEATRQGIHCSSYSMEYGVYIWISNLLIIVSNIYYYESFYFNIFFILRNITKIAWIE